MSSFTAGGSAYADAEITALAGWLRDGLSAGQIASLTDRSRNAIISIVHRNETLKEIGFKRSSRAGIANGHKATQVAPKVPAKPITPALNVHKQVALHNQNNVGAGTTSERQASIDLEKAAA